MSNLEVDKIREDISKIDKKKDEGLTIPDDIRIFKNLSYGDKGKWNLFDIYCPKDTIKKQKTIVNIHGGGWIYGTKETYLFYCMSLAQRGFTVVNFNYPLAPESPFPAAIESINNMFTWIEKHGEEYFIDLDKLFIVADSAGAQLASHYLAILNSEEFQFLYSFKIPKKINIKAVALNCGIYDIVNAKRDKLLNWYLCNEKNTDKVNTMKYLNGDFPPSFIMTSTKDFLKEKAKPFKDVLEKLGVECVMKVYGDNDKNQLNHVFHVNIKDINAKMCNDDECNFFNSFLVKQ